MTRDVRTNLCNTTFDVQFYLFRAEPRVGVRLFDCSLACLYFRESKFNISSFFLVILLNFFFSFSTGQFYFKRLNVCSNKSTVRRSVTYFNMRLRQV